MKIKRNNCRWLFIYLLRQQNNVGTIKIAHTAQEATERILNQEPLTFHVRFPYRYPIPKLVRIIYDNNLICDGPEGDTNSFDSFNFFH